MSTPNSDIRTIYQGPLLKHLSENDRILNKGTPEDEDSENERASKVPNSRELSAVFDMLQSKWRKIPRHPSVDKVGRLGKPGPDIQTFHTYGDEILVGYGNYNENTGPVDLYSFNKNTFSWTKYAENLETEAISHFVNMGEEVVALFVDPLNHKSWEYTSLGMRVSDGFIFPDVNVIHAFDGCELPDGSWWIVGSGWSDDTSTYDTYCGFLSHDRGESWETYPMVIDGDTTMYRRFYLADSYDGKPLAYSPDRGAYILENGNYTKVDDYYVEPGYEFGNWQFQSGDVSNPPTPYNIKDFSGDTFSITSTFNDNDVYYVGTSTGDIYYTHELVATYVENNGHTPSPPAGRE